MTRRVDPPQPRGLFMLTRYREIYKKYLNGIAPRLRMTPMTHDHANPEVGREVLAAGIRTNYHDVGQGFPVLLIHGSGPGVSAWANWRLTMPAGRSV